MEMDKGSGNVGHTIVVGRPGPGKTTSMSDLLAQMTTAAPSRIVAIEDAVELRMPAGDNKTMGGQR